MDFKWFNCVTMSTPVNLYILDYPDAMSSALHGIEDLFTIANRLAEQELFVLQRVSPSVSVSILANGVVIIPPCMAHPLPRFSDAETLTLLRQWHDSGVLLVASCAGVFWLANAGLLDGKQVTTHWWLCQQLADSFPKIERVCQHEMVVDQGDIVTAAGLYAFQDLSLHIMVRYAGYALAKKVADFCLLDLDGRLQAYYQRFRVDFSHGDSVVVKAQQYCAEHLSADMSIVQLASHCHTSQRTLLRRFKQATGFSPKQYLIQLRIEKAKQLIDLKQGSIEVIAGQLGYSDTSNFIKSFKKTAGVTPAEFRARQGGGEKAVQLTANGMGN